MGGNRAFWTTFYLWIRNLHLYFGLFVSPFVLVFAISTMMLNHNWKPDPTVEKSVHPIKLVEGLVDYPQARQILDQLNITGEVNFVRGFRGAEIVRIPVVKPGARTVVIVNVKTARLKWNGITWASCRGCCFWYCARTPQASVQLDFHEALGGSERHNRVSHNLSFDQRHLHVGCAQGRAQARVHLFAMCVTFLATLAGLLGA